MALTTLASLGGLFLLLGTTVQAAFTVVSTASSSLPTSQDAEYVCFFENLWTAASHPNDFPASAGFSQPIIIVHSSEYDLFEEGAVASPGMESLAETGSIVDVVNEIFEVNGDADNIVVDTVVGMEMDLGTFQRQTLRGLEVDDMHSLLSAAARISPSPDWFTGFSNFEPRDSTTNTWYYEFNLHTPPYDAGTQEGETYLQSLGGTSPAEPIVEITGSNAPTSGAFVNSAGDAVLPVADWRCRLVNGQVATPGTPPATTPIPTLSPIAQPSGNELTNATTATPTAVLSATFPPTMPTTMAPSFVPSVQPITAEPTASSTTVEPTASNATTAVPAVELATTLPTTASPSAEFATADPTAASFAAAGPSDAPSTFPTKTTAVSAAPSDQVVQISTSVPTLSPVESFSASPSDYPTIVPTLEASDAPSDVPTNVPTTRTEPLLTIEPTSAELLTSSPILDSPSEVPVVSLPADEAQGTEPTLRPTVAQSDAPSMQPSSLPTTVPDADRGGDQITELESAAGELVLPLIHLAWKVVVPVALLMLL